MKHLSKREKIRVIVFAALSLLSAVPVIVLALGICDMMTASHVDFDEISDLYIDGEDFTSCVMLGAGVLNGILMIIYFGAVVIYALLVAAGSALSNVILRVIALNGETAAGAAEYELSRKIFLVVSISQAVIPAAAAACYLISGGSAYGFLCLLLCWQYPLFTGLIYIKKLKRLAEAVE